MQNISSALLRAKGKNYAFKVARKTMLFQQTIDCYDKTDNTACKHLQNGGRCQKRLLQQKTLVVLQIIEHRLINLFSLRLYHSQLVCREGKLLRLLLQINIQLSQRRRQHLDEHFHAGMQLGHNRQHKEGQKADNDCKAQKQTHWTLET